jgi:serine O-acetyltransferase
VVKEVPEDATVVGIPGRIVVAAKDETEHKKRSEMAKKYGFDAYAVSPDNPDPVASAIGRMLDHISVMDEKVASLCSEVSKMGGDICQKELPNIEVDAEDFVEAGQRAAKAREAGQKTSESID